MYAISQQYTCVFVGTNANRYFRMKGFAMFWMTHLATHLPFHLPWLCFHLWRWWPFQDFWPALLIYCQSCALIEKWGPFTAGEHPQNQEAIGYELGTASKPSSWRQPTVRPKYSYHQRVMRDPWCCAKVTPRVLNHQLPPLAPPRPRRARLLLISSDLVGPGEAQPRAPGRSFESRTVAEYKDQRSKCVNIDEM